MVVLIVIVIAIVAICYFLKNMNSNNNNDSENDNEVPRSTERGITINLNFDLTMDLNTCLNNAEQNDICALYELGYRYYRGIEVKQDFYKAVNYARLSAENDTSDRSNGKMLYFVLYYNLGENYGINMRFAEKCLVDISKYNYVAKYYIAKIIDDYILKKIPTTFTEEGDLLSWTMIGLIHSVNCYVDARLPQSENEYGNDAAELIKDFKMFLYISAAGQKEPNGHETTEEEASYRANKVVLNVLERAENIEKINNKEELIRELELESVYK